MVDIINLRSQVFGMFEERERLALERRDAVVKVIDSREQTLRTELVGREKLYAERDENNQISVKTALDSASALVKAVHDADQKAIALSDHNNEKWRDSANEWRGAMVDREAKFVSKVEYETEFKAVRGEIDLMRKTVDRNEGRASGSRDLMSDARSNITLVISLVLFLGSLVTAIATFWKR